jgi:PBSX family phage portal protein
VAEEVKVRQRTRSTEIVVGDTRRSIRNKDDKGSVEMRMKEYVNSQALTDPFTTYYSTGVGNANDVLQPPYNPYALARLPYENSSLLQCIDAMVLNCHGHGWQLEYIGPDGKEKSTEAQAEKVILEKLLKFPNPDYSLQEICQRARFDKEAMGYFCIEAARDRKGRITSLFHIPAQTMRRTTRDIQDTQVEVKLPRDGSDTSVISKRYARFVQIVNEKKIYFKEFGDPRKIDPKTGQENTALKFEDCATEIIYSGIYYPTSPYGVPRWINQLPSIMGTRQAEMTNYDFFKDNAVPAMAVLVAGGVLTQHTLDQIEDQMTAIKGRASMHRMVFIEARGDEDLAATEGQVPIPKIELKPLRDAQQQDALFEKYEVAGEQKIRSAFRLPPLFVGRSQDITFASAQTSYEVAEGQVFGPERRQFDSVMDLFVLASYSAQFWAFRSQQAKITDADAIIKAMTAFDTMGAMTPNVAIRMANEFFDLQIDTISEPWGNYPFEIVAALAEAGKLEGTQSIERKVIVNPDGSKTDAEGNLLEAAPVPPGGNVNDPNAPDKTDGTDGTAKPNAVNGKKPTTGKKPVDEAPAAVKYAVAQALGDLRDILKKNADAQPIAA